VAGKLTLSYPRVQMLTGHQQHKETLGDSFDIHVAFSRETKQKVYVQHLIKTHAKDVIDMIDNGAIVYVCGDAKHMARDVNSTLISTWAEQRNISLESATERVKGLRDTARYQVSRSHLRLTLLLTSRRRISGRYIAVAGWLDGELGLEAIDLVNVCKLSYSDFKSSI
jgi:hypothetical protein